MIELTPLSLLILGELFMALLAFSGTLVFLSLARKERIRKAVWHLSERVRDDKPKRMERLKQLLSENYGYTGGELEKALHQIIQNEMRLYQNLINGSLKDDPLSLQQIDVDVANLVLAYHSLKHNQPPPPAETTEEDEGEELRHLREENQRLSDELRVTMDTMGRMLNEYSSMFAGGTSSQEEQQPESGTSDGQAPPSGEAEVMEGGYTGMETEDIDIPPFSLPGGAEDDGESLLDEEVSEIIDEVMEIADELTQGKGLSPAESPQGESLADEVSGVADIEALEDAADIAPDNEAPEPGSLEEEWAKLLEEDAASGAEKGPEK